ncbi:hypothetical protein WISP_41065 [Willisornis vidua]|uniref:Uncharacterized protein n=1 Tax=Willisornis vidua TaxID=1566151 RepID=A0ABQ9DLG3_9PASS|nr:hypothetical protein WISP_41065 [Willisornis vidua]
MLCLVPPRTWLAFLAAKALLTHIQLAIDQDPQVTFRDAALQPLVPQAVRTSKFAPSQVQNMVLVLVNLDMVDLSSIKNNLKQMQSPFSWVSFILKIVELLSKV